MIKYRDIRVQNDDLIQDVLWIPVVTVSFCDQLTAHPFINEC